jgi:hypothetical protein
MWDKCFTLVACLFCICFMLTAQVGTEGSFLGTVTDTSGAVVPSAQIEVTHLGTGFKKTATAEADGSFNILALPIGRYSVSVRATGFKTWNLPDTELTVGSRVRVSPVLSVGETSESVSVTADAELLQTETTSAETVVQMQQIRSLPLPTRNPLALVAVAPGMQYLYTQSGGERGTYVQGQGMRQNKMGFQLDGVLSNAPMDEGGTAIPNVDAVAEFSVETLNFSAEYGRNPMQVKVATKSGTNEYHGAVWEFNQNDAYNARNTFSDTVPRVRRNQFGGAVGGPIFKNRTFFFGNFESTLIGNAQVWNAYAITPAMAQGDFSALGKTIIDPTTNSPFPGNVIPPDRISGAAQFLTPYLLTANSPGGYYRNQTNTSNNTYEGTIRIDQEITPNQRIYGRYVRVNQPSTAFGYSPSAVTNDTVNQNNLAVNYTWTASPTAVLTVGGGMMRTNETYQSDQLGVTNYTQEAGIQGFPTEGREKWIGLPNLNFANGYQGTYYSGWGAPGQLYGGVYNGKAALHWIKGTHTIALGGEYLNVTTYGDHGSCCVRGTFNFYNQYTNDGFADFLLGYTSGSSRNTPLANFGTQSAPYTAFYANDSWRIKPSLSLEYGLRYERWYGRHNERDAAATWDPGLGMIVAANMPDGNINMNAFGNTAQIAAYTSGLWMTARAAGYPDNLYEGNNNWGPRVGVVYRPFKRDIVLRAGYGIFYNTITGNRTASASVNPPFWGVESVGFGTNQLQPMETVWSADPNAFGIFSIWESQDPRIKPALTQEWNVTVQAALPFQTALTVSYVGTRVNREVNWMQYNAPTVGPHDDLQADRPQPALSDMNRLENFGRSWYNALQTKFEKRYSKGVAFTFAYSFSRTMGVGMDGVDEYSPILQYSPEWYNRGRAAYDIRQVEFATLVWELPYGRGRSYGSQSNRFVDAVLGGWNLNVTQSARSGQPLSIDGGYPNLGNGNGTRADIVGNPGLGNPSPSMWFNTAAFGSPALYTWGSSSMGIVEGPGFVQFNTGLSKQFRFTESKVLELRGEAFNVFNHVNYNNPDTGLTSGNFGQITSAATARYLQLGLKFMF